MTDKEKKILENFKVVIPKLSERKQDRLLWMGEGMAFMKEKDKKEEEKDKQPA